MMIIKKPLQFATVIDRQGDYGVFDTMNDAIRLAYKASVEYSNLTTERKNKIINTVIDVIETHLEELSKMTYKEIGTTSNNSYDDILYNNTVSLMAYKNSKFFEYRFPNENEKNDFEKTQTVYGVIVSEPNLIKTIISNFINALSSGNGVVFSSNKDIKHVFSYTVQLINKALITLDGPKNLIVTVKEPSDENTNILNNDERITLISQVENNIENIAL